MKAYLGGVMNIKKILLSGLFLGAGFAFAHTDRSNVNKVVDILKNLGMEVKESMAESQGELLRTTVDLSTRLEEENFFDKRFECEQLGYKKNLNKCPQYNEIKAAYTETPEYKQWEPLMIQRDADYYLQSLIESVVTKHQTHAEKLGDFKALRLGLKNSNSAILNNRNIDIASYANESTIETEAGKVQLTELLEDRFNKVANIIEELKEQQ